MLLESALFLHPHIASALVGQMAHGVTKLAKWEGKKLNKDLKESLSADQEVFKSENGPDSISGETEGNADDYDPWACSSDSDCPTEPFEYECVNERCVPILPERVVDDSTMREVMAEQFYCWRADYNTTRWCGAVYPKQWPRATYPSWSYTVGEGEYESTKTARGGHPNALKLRQSIEYIPESGDNDWNVADMGKAIKNSNGMQWFGKVQRDYIDYTVELSDDDDVPLWRKILGGPLVWVGWLKSGLQGEYLFQWVTTSCGAGCAGAKPHQYLNQIPADTPEEDRAGKYGIQGSQERYDLSRNADDYGWGKWLTTPWYEACGGPWWSISQLKLHCCNMDCRCHSRVRYKATITPDPMDARFINTSNGQISGALYGLDASAEVQNHTLRIDIQAQDTSGTFTSSFANAAGDEYRVNVYEYGQAVYSETVVTNSKGIGTFIYHFPNEGLYQFTVDRVLSGNGCVVTQPDSGNAFFEAISPYFINFGVFVNPPPPKRGCTNKDDMFYDPDALIEDGTCLNEGGQGNDNGDENTPSGGGKGDIGSMLKRIDLTKDNMAKGVAVASCVFLGIMFVAAKEGGK